MAFWDGGRWLPERAPTEHPTHRTTADLLATGAIVIVTLAFAFPWLAATATGPSITLTPASGLPGASVTVSGAGFTSKARVAIVWDGQLVVPSVNVAKGGTLKARFTVPSAGAGRHSVDVSAVGGKTALAASAVLASTSFTVLGSSVSDVGSSPSPTPTPGTTATPTGTPGPTATATPTPDPTATATPTPDPTATATPTPDPTATPTPTPRPTATPTPAPTPTPTPRPTATPTAAPTPSSPWSVPFMSRPASGPIVISGKSNVTVSGLSFKGATGPAVVIQNSSNVTITANDFSGDVGGIYCINSTNVTVTWNRFFDIGNGTIGSGHSNYIQFNTCTGGYIAHNKGKGGDTEDMVSIYKSGGPDAAHPLVIEDNHFESPLPPDSNAWSSTSGSGFMSGDAGGAHIVIRNNTMLNVGQVGIGVPSGTDIRVLDNIAYGVTRPGANVGIYVWNQYPTACSGIEIAGNRVYWKNASGANNSFWNGNNCSSVTLSGNTWNDASISAASLAVAL